MSILINMCLILDKFPDHIVCTRDLFYFLLLGNQTIVECELSGASYYGYFILAQCFHAVGGAAVYTLAIPYMDDQVKTKNTPLYIGMILI
jgi:hypothetical protein